MSTVKANNVQVGQSGTASQNFTLYQPSTPDGTVRLAVGNSGATTGDVLSVSSTGLSVTGTLTSTGVNTFPAGSASAPSITTTGDTNTGVYFPGADSVAITTGGTAAVTVDSGQRTKFPTTIGIGNATPSTSGAGITFPATQSASSDANTLDDYEEGTWTPTYLGTSSNPTITYNASRAGDYTKVGRLVTCRGTLRTDSVSGGSGNVEIGGLPFTANSSNDSGYGMVNVYIAADTTFNTNYPIGGQTNPNNTTASLNYRSSANGPTLALPISDLKNVSNSSFIKFMIIYTT